MIKVLVVDDSLFMRKLISDILNDDPGMEVIATAKSGQDALEKLEIIKPDVITLDLIMPGGDGLLFDSLSTLLIYNHSETVCKFVHDLVNNIKSSHTTAIFTALEGDTESQLLKEMGMFVDSVEHCG